ncbi:hypothetical protein GCM10028820_26680 [Tessaracoccus terricola]
MPTNPRSRSRRTIPAAVCLLLLVACAPASDPAPPDPTPPSAPEQTTPASTPSVPATEPPGSDPNPTPEPVAELAAVECPEVDRELSEVERRLLVEPAPFSGEAFDADAVLGAIEPRHPADLEGWAAHIRSQIQAEYAPTVCETIGFSAAIGAPRTTPEESAVPAPEDAPVGRNHFALVLDASGSMAAASAGETRMTAAKAALGSFTEELPAESTVSVRVYGHEGSNRDADKAVSCAASELVYQGTDPDAVAAGIADVKPVGWTPLAKAITDAAGDIPEGTTDAIVYVVTDGLETCDGDPVAAASQLAASGVAPIVNVIGFDVGDADLAALQAIAEAGGGEFTRVGSEADLRKHWEDEQRRMAAAWREWRNEELGRIRQQGIENTRRAGQLAGTLKELAHAQHEQASQVLDLMRSRETLPKRDLDNLRWLLDDQRKEVTNYAFDTGNANEAAALAALADRWTEVYDTGNSKWLEYYEKARGEA